MKTPAERIIEKCGGPKALASLVGVDLSRVHRWTYPKAKGGTDGRIPSRHHQKLLDRARENGISLSPADFFESPEREIASTPEEKFAPIPGEAA